MGHQYADRRGPTGSDTARRRFLQTVAGIGAASVAGVRSTGTVLASSGDVIWNVETAAAVRSSPTVVNGAVYVGGLDATIYSLATGDGTERWRFETTQSVRSSPTVVDGWVFVGSDNGSVYALEETTGAEQWDFATGGAVRSSPTVSDGRVYVGSDDNNLYALDTVTGTEQWRFATGGRVRSSPTVSGGRVYVGSDDNSVYAIDAGTGDRQWQFQTGGEVRSSPTVAGGTVYVGSEDSRVYALDGDTGDEQWQYETGGPVTSSPTVAGGTVYVGSEDSRVYALDGEGAEQWRFATGGAVGSSPTAVGETVYVGSSDNYVYALDGGIYARWRSDIGGEVRSSPTVANGTIYVGSEDSHVYALDAGVSGASEGSRVSLGTLGHESSWAEETVAVLPASFGVEIAGTNAPVGGETVDVTVTVTNNGDRTDTKAVEVRVDGLGSESLTLTLEGGQSTTSSVSFQTAPEDSGDYSVTASSESDADSATIVVSEPATTGKKTPTPTTETTTPPTGSQTGAPSNGRNNVIDGELILLGSGGGLLALGGAYAIWRRSNGDDSRATDRSASSPAGGTGETTERETDVAISDDDSMAESDSDEPVVEKETNLTGARYGQATDNPVPTEIPTVSRLSLDYEDITKEAPIGSGGQADVYRATVPTETTELTVAVKEPRMADMRDAETIKRLVLKEAETWQKLDSHDHIVGIVDCDSEPHPWIVMEYMDVGHLGDRAGEMDIQQSVWTAIATTKAVRHAHRRGVAHLDLKPQNILFRSVEGAWDVPKVADWGLSKKLLEHSQSVEGMSPHYAAPEQFEESYGTTDDITDVFQLGVVFYVLFTGRPPFEGQPVRVMNKVLNEQPTPPSELADIPPELDDIILTAMATEKEDRYESVLYLRDELQEVFDSM